MFNKRKAENDAEEFQPDAIYLENQKPTIPLQTLWFVLLILLIIGIIWASIAKVDKIVVAEGKIITTRAPLTIKPLERTIIESVNVVAGQRVKKGEVLITLDPSLNNVEQKKLRERYYSLKAQLNRLIAENNNTDYKFDEKDNLYGDCSLQNMIFTARKNFYDAKMISYNENIAMTEKTVDSLTESKSKYNLRQDKVNQIASMLEDLEKQNVTSTKELLETQVSVIGMAVEIDNIDMQLMSYQHQLMIMKAEKNTFVTDWKKTLVEELVSVERDYKVTEREIVKYEEYASYLNIVAPCDAVVHEIAPFQEGSAVREAESLITLIPLDVPLEAEVDVMAKDVGIIRIGDFARIKFDAFPFQQNGTLDGEVRYISQDAFERGQNAANANPRAKAEQKGSFYQVRLKLGGEFKNNKNEILPGMRIVTEIKIGERRVISYLINPFVKALNESIREP